MKLNERQFTKGKYRSGRPGWKRTFPSDKIQENFMKKNHFDKESEIKIAGVNAVKVAFKARPQDTIKFYLSKNLLKTFADITKFCSQNKKAYHVVEDEELQKVSGSTHHEGVVILMRKKNALGLDQFLKNLKKDEAALILALENVSNPHNVGAIMRSAAHFGVKAILMPKLESAQNSAAYRTAEGGAEALEFIEAKAFKESLQKLQKNGFDLLATSSHAKEDLFQSKLNSRTVIVMGEEREGLSKDIMKLCEKTISISGTGAVESLNVSVATAIICAHYWKTFQK